MLEKVGTQRGRVVSFLVAIGAIAMVAVPLGWPNSGDADQKVTVGAIADTGSQEATDSVGPAIEAAGYYLPKYEAGAQYAGQLSLEDRRTLAVSSLETWKGLEARNAQGDRGERDLRSRLDSTRESLEMSDAEFAELLEKTSEEDIPVAKRVRDAFESGDVEQVPMIQPIYSEVADLCGEAGSVALFASGDGGEQPALKQYDAAERVRNVPDAVIAAWSISPGAGVSTFAWQTSDTPEVLIVAAAVSSSCDLLSLVEQVSIE